MASQRTVSGAGPEKGDVREELRAPLPTPVSRSLTSCRPVTLSYQLVTQDSSGHTRRLRGVCKHFREAPTFSLPSSAHGCRSSPRSPAVMARGTLSAPGAFLSPDSSLSTPRGRREGLTDQPAWPECWTEGSGEAPHVSKFTRKYSLFGLVATRKTPGDRPEQPDKGEGRTKTLARFSS